MPSSLSTLANPLSPTRRVYRAIVTEVAVIGAVTSLGALLAAAVVTAALPAALWGWGPPFGWYDLFPTLLLLQVVVAMMPGLQLSMLISYGQRRLYPNLADRILHVLEAFAMLVICAVPFALALAYAVANHLLVTITLRRMLDGFDPWHVGGEHDKDRIGAPVAAAAGGIAVDWQQPYFRARFKGRVASIKPLGSEGWAQLPCHGQRALLVTAAAQMAFILTVIVPVVVVRLFVVVS